MGTQKLLARFVDRRTMIVALVGFVLLSTINFMYAQNNNSKNNAPSDENVRSDVLDISLTATIPIVVAILGLVGVMLGHLITLRNPPSSAEKEVVFRNIVTKRLEKLAKDSWTTMREHPENLNIYWEDLRKGHIPEEFQENLRNEGYEFAVTLLGNKIFRNIAPNITDSGVQKMLKDLRTNLKNDYQKRMVDVIPKLVSTAVDSAYESSVTDVKIWSKNALENLKPLLLSTEAIDNENNLMTIIRAEINKRLQTKEG